MDELPEFVRLGKTSELVELYDEFINNSGCCMTLKEIKYVDVTETLKYVGYCSEDGRPDGLGAIFGRS